MTIKRITVSEVQQATITIWTQAADECRRSAEALEEGGTPEGNERAIALRIMASEFYKRAAKALMDIG